jgi:hypothetical protein
MSAGGSTVTRIVILANNQHAGLAAALRALLPAARIDDFNLANLAADGPARRLAIEAVGAANHVVSHDATSQFGPLSTAALRSARRPLHLLPAFRFTGFHPDTVTITLDGRELDGPTGLLHSRTAVASYMAGLTVAETAEMYNRLVFARLGYFEAFDAQRARLIKTFAVYGYDLVPAFAGWIKAGCFMFDATRPRMRVLLDIGRLLCGRIGIDPADGATEATVQNPLAGAPMQPLFADIAARIGVSPEGSFRGPAPSGARPPLLSLDDFIAASFAQYKRVPLFSLRAAEGLTAALDALYLHEADFGRGAARMRAAAAAPDDTVLFTWHGKLLSIETATGTLVQAPPWQESADSTPAAVRLNRPLAAPAEVALGGGTIAAPGSHPGTITLTQQDRILTAPPRLLALRFVPANSSPHALFLPLPREDLAILRAIAAGNWTEGDDDTPLCGSAVQLRPGFVLAVGRHNVDLAAARFTRRAAADGTVRIVIETPERTVALTASDDRETGVGAMPSESGDLEAVPVAASLEQFRAAPNHRLILSGPGELIHLPLTADDNARRWLADAQPPLGRRNLRATAVRAADKFVRLDRGAEGIIFSADGIFAGADCVSSASTLEPGAIEAAPKLEFPVCVFYKPNLLDLYGWLAEAALTLHVLQQMLPPEGRLLLPGTLAETHADGFDPLEWLSALGLTGAAVVRTQAPLVRAADVTWLAQDPIADVPAFLMQSFRGRCHSLHKPSATRRRVYLTPPEAPQLAKPIPVENFLTARGFETIVAEDLAPAEFIALFAAAEFIVAPHGAVLAGLLFCQPGTRVLELSPDAAFQPQFWQISEKLGLCHAVLPCALSEDGLVIEFPRFRALFRMLRLTEV